MFCKNCGKQIEASNNACPYCGTLIERKMPAGDGNQYAQIFVEPDENFISSFGNGYKNSFLTGGKVKSCIAFLSDKRIYLRGRMIDVNSNKLQKIDMRKTIDLEDITGTGLIYNDPVWKLVLAILLFFSAVVIFASAGSYDALPKIVSLAMFIPAILLLASYVMTRYTLFFIEYAGGCIKFEASMHNPAEAMNFEKLIRRAKNNVKK